MLALATVLVLVLLPGAPLHAAVPWLRAMTTSEAPTAATQASRAAASRDTSGDTLTARAAAASASAGIGPARGVTSGATWNQAALAAGKSLPMYSFVAYLQTLDDGQSALRFVFSLDPTVAAMTGRRVPVPLGPRPPGP